MKNRVPAPGAVFVLCITAGILGLTGCWRRRLAALSVVAAVVLVVGQPVPSLADGRALATAPVSAGPFNKVWTYALSQYAQASQTGQSLTQLSDGTVGTCRCAQDTNTTPQALDLQAYPASFTAALPGLAFSAVGIKGAPTSVKPTTLYP